MVQLGICLRKKGRNVHFLHSFQQLCTIVQVWMAEKISIRCFSGNDRKRKFHFFLLFLEYLIQRIFLNSAVHTCTIVVSVTSRRDRNPGEGRNSVPFTNSSKGSFSCRTWDSPLKHRTFIKRPDQPAYGVLVKPPTCNLAITWFPGMKSCSLYMGTKAFELQKSSI